MNFFVTGVNFRTASVDVLENVSVKEEDLGASLGKIMASMDLTEAVLLSTCNRVELYWVPEASRGHVISPNSCFHQFGKTPCHQLEDHIYTLDGRSAVTHLFRVTSSIDSMVVGEPQITGQVKKAYEIAKAYDRTGKVSHRLFPAAFSVAKKVRTRTGISKGAVSVASVSVKRAKDFFPDFSDKSALLIGAGEMAERAAFHLKNNNLGTLFLFNRSSSHAVTLAEKYGGITVSGIQEALAEVDIVITSTSSPEYLIVRNDMVGILRNRRQRPLLIIDIGIPRNVDPEVGRMGNVRLMNIDDLGKIVDDQKARREREIKMAEKIIQAGVDSVIRGFHRSALASNQSPSSSNRQISVKAAL
jgi:glutamyl-tRNA reductase